MLVLELRLMVVWLDVLSAWFAFGDFFQCSLNHFVWVLVVEVCVADIVEI